MKDKSAEDKERMAEISEKIGQLPADQHSEMVLNERQRALLAEMLKDP